MLNRVLPIRIACLFLIGMALPGCSSTQIVSPDALPLYGSSPFEHTVYTGSDARFHYFSASHNKMRYGFKVPVEKADIYPRAFERTGDGHAFIEKVDGRVIHLIVIGGNPDPPSEVCCE